MKRKITALCTTLLFMSMNFSGIAFAAEPNGYDSERSSGNIQITYECDGVNIDGAEITMVQIGTVAGSLSFADAYENTTWVVSPEYKDCFGDKALDEYTAAEMLGISKEAQAVYNTNDTVGIEAWTDKNGIASFGSLDLGLYLVMQTDVKPGSTAELYEYFSPYIITVPMQMDGKWVYDISAKPKTETEIIPTTPETVPETPTVPETTPEQPTVPDKPDKPIMGIEEDLSGYLFIGGGFMIMLLCAGLMGITFHEEKKKKV